MLRHQRAHANGPTAAEIARLIDATDTALMAELPRGGLQVAIEAARAGADGTPVAVWHGPSRTRGKITDLGATGFGPAGAIASFAQRLIARFRAWRAARQRPHSAIVLPAPSVAPVPSADASTVTASQPLPTNVVLTVTPPTYVAPPPPTSFAPAVMPPTYVAPPSPVPPSSPIVPPGPYQLPTVESAPITTVPHTIVAPPPPPPVSVPEVIYSVMPVSRLIPKTAQEF